jgi:outer membrane protein assembly factor BamE
MPDKMLKESAKQAQQAAPKAPEAKAVEPKSVEVKPAEVKPVTVKPAEPVAPAKVEAEKAPISKKDMPLPPEDAPGYFERMLEKIGF